MSAGGDRPVWTRPSQPPDRDQLETAAAHTATRVLGAWWRTLQVVDHVFEGMVQRDPRTLEPLPGSLHTVLDALAAHRRLAPDDRDPLPLPLDELAIAARTATRPLARVLQSPSTRIQRDHVMQAANRLREVDARSIAWLAQRPGRTIREKLGGRARALGVVRQLTADTWENRVIARLVEMLRARVEARLDNLQNYGDNPALQTELEALERQCTSGWRRSMLDEVTPTLTPRANNTLLDHPDYAVLWRLWGLLRARDERLSARWSRVEKNFRAAVLWLLWARLMEFTGATTWERVVVHEPGRVIPVAEGHHPGAPPWVLIPDVLPASMPAWWSIRLCLDGDHLHIDTAYIQGHGLLTGAPSWSLRVKLDADMASAPSAGRGIPWRAMPVHGLRGTWRGFADLIGAIELTEWLAEQSVAPGVTVRTAKRDATGVAGAARRADIVGIDWCGAQWLVHGDDAPWIPDTQAAVTRVEVGESRVVEWRVARAGQRFHPKHPELDRLALDDALDDTYGAQDRDRGRQNVAIERMIEAVSAELGGRPAHGVAWTVPDRLDELSQRALRAAMSVHFGLALPVWRSVAAALAWQAAAPQSVRDDLRNHDVLLVLDSEGPALCATVLVARKSDRLLRARPETGGMYWERRPALPLDEHSAGLSARHITHDYARRLIADALAGAEHDRSERARLVESLMAGGVDTLLDPDGAVCLPRGDGWLVLTHDGEAFDQAMDRWQQALGAAVSDWRHEGPMRDLLTSLPRRQRPVRVLLIGRPFSAWAHPDDVISALDPLHGNLFFESVGTDRGDLARGAWHAQERARAGLPAWTDWLPDLYLEVVRDGLYDQLKLVEERQVDASLGAVTTIDVEQTLVLPAGHSSYRFPLESGRRNRRPLHHEVRLQSPALPLSADLPVRLQLTYRYGFEHAWELRVTPVQRDGAPFSTIEATWEQARGPSSPTDPGPVPPFAQRAARSADAIERALEWLSDFAREVPGLLARRNWERDHEQAGRLATRLRKMWWTVYAVADAAPDQFRSTDFRHLQSWLLGLSGAEADARVAALDTSVREHRHLRVNAGLFLACMGVHCPARLAEHAREQFDRALGDPTNLGSQLAHHVDVAGRLLASRPAPQLQRALWNILCNVQPRRSPRLYQRALDAWTRVLWTRESFVTKFSLGAVRRLVHVVERQLRHLVYRVSGVDHIAENQRGRFLSPYRVCCELLLALLRLRGTPAGRELHAGRPRMSALARLVRRLDGMLAVRGCALNARTTRSQTLHLQVDRPAALRRVSPLAWVLSSMLIGSDQLGLVRIEASNDA